MAIGKQALRTYTELTEVKVLKVAQLGYAS